MAARNSSSKNSKSKNINEKPQKSEEVMKELMIWITLIISVILLLCVFGLCGPLNNVFGAFLFGMFGFLAYIFPFLLFLLVAIYYVNKKNKRVKSRIFGCLGMYIILCAIVQLAYNDEVDKIWECYTFGHTNHAGGGFIGGCISMGLTAIMGGIATTIILIILEIMLLAFVTGRFIASRVLDKGSDRYNRHVESIKEKRDSKPVEINNRGRRRSRSGYTLPAMEGDNTATAADNNKNDTSDIKVPEKTVQTVKHEKTFDHSTPSENDISDVSDPFENVVIHRPDSDMPNFEKEVLEKFGGKDNITPSNNTTPEEKPQDITQDPHRDTVPEKEISIQENKHEKQEESTQTASEEEVSIEMPPEPIPYQFPSIELLSRPKRGKANMSDRALKETALKLQECLKSFKVDVTMTDIICGPTVTRFELQPALGTRVKKITELENDIKLNLAAPDIRIEAPIPGKSAVGIEVPNSDNVMITLREMIETDEFQEHKSKVAFAVGKDIGGKNIIADIAKMPHLLIAGSTGSGKSVCINTIIMSIIYKADPNDVKLIMVDPKVVELSVYNGIPHLCIPVVTDPKKAAAALNWAVAEMNDRYSKFAELGVRDMSGFNRKVESLKNKNPNLYRKMPQIVIIVDELADLMMVASHDVETAIARLAQMARAAGIHLIIATQRPSVDVITGLIKANVPSRIAFAVSSQVDSRTILDGAGAEKLLGKGDMLYFPQGISKPVRVQGAFVSDSEVAKVASFIKNQYTESVYDESIDEKIKNVELSSGKNNQAQSTAIGDAEDEDGRDALFADAGRYIIEKEKASIGNLQRVFKIGFNRGARIMDQLCEAGVVSEEDGKKPRNILMTMEQFEQFLAEGK